MSNLPTSGQLDVDVNARRPQQSRWIFQMTPARPLLLRPLSIYKKTKDGTGCDQLRYYAENAAEDGEGLECWRDMRRAQAG
jgi:hypothetical protein